jgi:hypothetical protein
MVANKPIRSEVRRSLRVVRFRKPDLEDAGHRLTSASR